MSRTIEKQEGRERPDLTPTSQPRVNHNEVVAEFDGVCSTRNVRVWERTRPSGEMVRGTREIGRVSEPMS